jgi:hypothetical protein
MSLGRQQGGVPGRRPGAGAGDGRAHLARYGIVTIDQALRPTRSRRRGGAINATWGAGLDAAARRSGPVRAHRDRIRRWADARRITSRRLSAYAEGRVSRIATTD